MKVEIHLWARKSAQRMRGVINQILGLLILAATLLVLSGCEFGSDNIGDIYGRSQPAQDSGEHNIPASQQSGNVTGEPGPQTSRY